MECGCPVVTRTDEREKAVRVVFRAISASADLRETLFLKGAYAIEGLTGLSRSTKDVDFSVVEALAAPDSEGEAAVSRLFADAVENHLQVRDPEWSLRTISVHRSPKPRAHPRGWDSFKIGITLRFRGRAEYTVRLDVTPEQPPIDAVELSFEEGAIAVAERPEIDTMKSYSGAEALAEKLRAFLQSLPPHRSKIGGGNRPPRVRDIRDIAAIMKTIGDRTDIETVVAIFARKCRSRYVDCTSVGDFAPEPGSIEIFRQAYENDKELAEIPFDEAWNLMMELVRRISSGYGLPGTFPLPKD